MRSMNYRRSKALCIVLAFSCLLAEKMQARWEDTTFPLTSGQTWVNASTNTRYTVSGQAGNLTLTVSVADAGKNGGKGSVADNASVLSEASGALHPHTSARSIHAIAVPTTARTNIIRAITPLLLSFAVFQQFPHPQRLWGVL